jgi:hypothetical protein
MSKVKVSNIWETEIEDWDYCNAKEYYEDAEGGEVSKFSICKYCIRMSNDYKCQLFEKRLYSHYTEILRCKQCLDSAVKIESEVGENG